MVVVHGAVHHWPIDPWDAGIRYFDTAPHYGLGLSEQRLGPLLAQYPRADYLVSSKVGALEPVDDIKKRIKEAEKFVALEQLALSPQCGFASTEEGNVLADDEQWAKLKEIVAISKDVWK